MVAATLEIEILSSYPWGQITFQATFSGSYYNVQNFPTLSAVTIDPVLIAYENHIDSFAYVVFYSQKQWTYYQSLSSV